MLYIWHEDNPDSATQQFWEFLRDRGVSNKLYNASIKSFSGWKNLYKHAKYAKYNPCDKYIIFMDYVKDNKQIRKYHKNLREILRGLNNVYVSDMLCFEYLILSFKHLETWTKPAKPNNQYKYMCRLITLFKECQDNGDSGLNNDEILEYVKRTFTQKELEDISSEKIASSLLTNLTPPKSPFKINKATLGYCWTCSCCDKVTGERLCNIYKYKKTSEEKARNLWNCTLASSIINKHG